MSYRVAESKLYGRLRRQLEEGDINMVVDVEEDVDMNVNVTV